MKVASTKKSLLIVIILLLIIDAVILFFFVAKNKPDHGHQQYDRKEGGLYAMLKNETHFSPEQLAEYQILREEQFENVKPLFSNIRRSKDAFYSLLYDTHATDSAVSSLADSIAYHQKILDIQMLSYFRKVRSLSTPDQLPAFDSSIKKVVMRMTGRQGRSRSKSDSLPPSQTHSSTNK